MTLFYQNEDTLTERLSPVFSIFVFNSFFSSVFLLISTFLNDHPLSLLISYIFWCLIFVIQGMIHLVQNVYFHSCF